MPQLRQLHLHQNRITDCRELCRKNFENLEVLDIGNNKIREVPIALVFYLSKLNMLAMANNDITHMPNWIGFHNRLSTLQIDGNPLKMIRRAIIDKGTQEIMRYLRDKFVEGKDDQVEEWAKEMNKAQNEYFAQNLQPSAQSEDQVMFEETKMASPTLQNNLRGSFSNHVVPTQTNSSQDGFMTSQQH